MIDKTVRTRFAPSPTGHLHVGGARTALFNYLYAKSAGGRYILRIEDTDQERSTSASLAGMLESMLWLGLDWDEGPGKGGSFGPYIQSQRLDIYQKYIDKLLNSGQVYRCFCTQEELEQEKKIKEEQGSDPVYSGKCRGLSEPESRELQAKGKPFTIRFKSVSREILVEDMVQGNVRFDTAQSGDFIIVKSDGFPTYNFAVVVDDFLMEISHVIRGVGHLSNTPRQMLLIEAMGFPLPRYAHVSQIVGPDRKKLSKRHGATSLAEYRKEGYLPEAFLNYLALLGWSSPDGEEFIRKERLEKIFDISRSNKSDAIFDHAKLRWLNGKYIREYPLENIMELVQPYLKALNDFPAAQADLSNESFRKIISVMRDYFEVLSEAPGFVAPFYLDSVSLEDEAKVWLQDDAGKKAVTELLNILNAKGPVAHEDFFQLIKDAGKSAGAKGKNLFMAVRSAMTGCVRGPELPVLYDLLGHERVTQRITENLKNI